MHQNRVSRVYSLLFNYKVLFFLILITSIAFIYSLWNRYIYIDDAFFGEQAYWLAKDGVVKLPTMIDFLGCEHQLFSYHKLNIFIGAGLIKLFGWSVTPLRAVSLLFFGGLLWLLIYYIRRYPEKFGKNHLYIAVFIIFCNPLVVQYAFTFRPEIWVAFLGFVSYYFIEKTINSDLKRYPVFAGIFAGLAFLTHLNGLIFPVAGFVCLLSGRKYKQLFYYVIFGILIGLLYFWDLWQGNNLLTWLYQLKNWPDNNASNYMSDGFLTLVKNVFLKLCSEHQRFFWSDRSWGVSAFFLINVIASFKFLIRNHRILMIYTLSLIICLNIAGGQIAERFLLYFYPFFSLIIAISMIHLLERNQIIVKFLLILVLFFQIFATSKMFAYIYGVQYNYPQMHTRIFDKLPNKKALVLVPYQFIFNGLESFNLASFKGFEYCEVLRRKPFTQESFFRRADSLNIQYIIFPKDKGKYHFFTIPCFNTLKIDSSPGYTQFLNNKEVLIFKSLKN